MAVCVALLLYAVHGEHRRLEWLAKPAASATFIVTGVLAGGLDSSFGRIILVGLLLAAGGDVLLIPRGKATFLAGLLSFLAGHVAYAVAFALRGLHAGTLLVAVVAVTAVGAVVLRWLWPHVEAKMRVPVLAYVVVISAMVALAAGTATQTDAWLLLAGALAFYLSDLSVARDRFVERAFVNRLWGLPLYFFAQMLLASQAGG
jgi:uncharacterized membrane protein YhhN